MEGPLQELPDDLPVPQNDGQADHLMGLTLPDLFLPSTAGDPLSLSSLTGTCVLFFYPMTGEPGKPLPTDWISIPGAAGCTLESCGFRDLYAELQELRADVFGVSTQTAEVQLEAKNRLGLPFHLLSDKALALLNALKLPKMYPDGLTMCKRLTLITRDRKIAKVFYPVFPPDQHAEEILLWLKEARRSAS